MAKQSLGMWNNEWDTRDNDIEKDMNLIRLKFLWINDIRYDNTRVNIV